MNKPVSRQAHGFTGYIYIPFTAYAPEMVGFTRNKMATQLCKLLAAGILTPACLPATSDIHPENVI